MNKILSKASQLVAWTDKGLVKMIPSLVAEMAEPLVRRVQEVEDEPFAWGEKAQIEQLIRQSRAHEALGRFFLSVDYWQDAFIQFYEAATHLPAVCSDLGWLDAGEGYLLCQPLERRFFAMYGLCRRLCERHPALKESIQWRQLGRDYRVVTTMYRIWDAEFDEAFETIRAWQFGKDA